MLTTTEVLKLQISFIDSEIENAKSEVEKIQEQAKEVEGKRIEFAQEMQKVTDTLNQFSGYLIANQNDMSRLTAQKEKLEDEIKKAEAEIVVVQD